MLHLVYFPCSLLSFTKYIHQNHFLKKTIFYIFAKFHRSLFKVIQFNHFEERLLFLPGVALNTAEKFNPHTNTWSPIASMNCYRASACCAVVNGKIYIIGEVFMYRIDLKVILEIFLFQNIIYISGHFCRI